MGVRLFDVQLMGGIVLHEGDIAEMKTGEGKTFVATQALYLNAIPGNGVHLVTTNDYLAQRDRAWTAPVFEALGQAYDVAEKGEMWRPRLAKSDAVQQVLADEVALATAGDHTPAEALKRAEERINKMRLS